MDFCQSPVKLSNSCWNIGYTQHSPTLDVWNFWDMNQNFLTVVSWYQNITLRIPACTLSPTCSSVMSTDIPSWRLTFAAEGKQPSPNLILGNWALFSWRMNSLECVIFEWGKINFNLYIYTFSTSIVERHTGCFVFHCLWFVRIAILLTKLYSLWLWYCKSTFFTSQN